MLTINNTLDGYLKDVEIKGNTIQDAENLADIRSVGDKVEGQELYEIPVLSVGKNLITGLELGTFDNQTGTEIASSQRVRCIDYIKIDSSKEYIFSLENESRSVSIKFYDDNKLYLGTILTHKINNTNIPQYTKYIKFDMSVTDVNSTVQLEEGTQATPYEPYQEDKLTILSPVQLEKVGDVADRIICKDGVWGVEKNVVEFKFTDATSCTTLGVNSNGLYGYSGRYSFGAHRQSISNKLPFNYNWNSSTPCFYIQDADFVALLNENLTIDEFKLQYSDMVIKYLTDTPQFIPLPHDQQIKLRTFANKTNISFGCEIEGTIKAQVPKSLGATVNTHTEQINNLNKELDRVKKLEENTVSTVTTESDFTTVEATSNGYFEDVKLEGKTLVNLAPSFDKTLTANGTFQSELVLLPRVLDVGEYTMIVKVKTNTLNASTHVAHAGIQLSNSIGENLGDISKSVFGTNTGVFVNKINLLKQSDRVRLIVSTTATDGQLNICDLLILEGDHTQNPPSYFEGLKSIGQSASEDGADEIVVLSCNENLFPIKDFTINNSDWFSFRITNHFEKNTSYTISGKHRCSAEGKNPRFVFEYTDGTSSTNNGIATPTISNFSVTSDKNKTVKHIKMAWSSSAGSSLYELNDVMLVRGESSIPYIPHQSNKKRLLYYNNETQAWEKPILREWDSIEKHADGKYYYHQRSGEVVLNGSENWVDRSSNYISDTQTRFSIAFNTKPCSNTVVSFICDKYRATLTIPGMTSVSENGICSNVQGSMIYVTVPKTTLAEFKTTLQANPVTLVYKLAEEKVYECTNIDLITYANETNYIVESGAIAPKTTLKVHNNISNVVSLLQKKVSLLEDTVTSYIITQNRLMLASRYNADTVSFKVDVATLRNFFEYDNDLYELILNNILVGKDNYNRDYIENLIVFYWMDFVISDEMYSTLFEIIEEQHNPKVIEEAPLI